MLPHLAKIKNIKYSILFQEFTPFCFRKPKHLLRETQYLTVRLFPTNN